MTDVATLQAWLSQAQTALQNLYLGKQLVEIRHGQSEVMRFAVADIGKLQAYIADLKGQLSAQGVQVEGGRIRARAVFF